MAKKSPQPPETAPQQKPNETERMELRDEQGVRTKSGGHKKVTADKWNQ